MQRLASLVAVAALAATASAQFTLVAPNGYANVEGNSNNAYPFNLGATPMRVQFLYDSTNFTLQGVVSPIIISRLRYRADAATATWAGGSWPNVRIDLATSPVDFLAASGTYANNLGPDLTTVMQGPVVVQPGTATTPGPWYIDIPFTTNFLYDPTTGNDLTIDIQRDGVGWSGTSAQMDHVAAPSIALSTRVYSTAGFSVPTGTVGTNYGAVCEFSWVPASGLFASFTSNVTGGGSPLAVQFTNQTFTSDPGGVLTYAWDLDGDSVIDSNLPNPSFVYNNCGDYNVSLTVTDATHPPNTLTRPSYIRTDIVTPSFTFAQIVPGVVQFTDTSVPTPTSWAWDLNGDSVVDSTAQNPVWVYPGTCSSATITLTVSRLCKGPFAKSDNLVLSPATFTTLLTGGNGLSGVGSGNTFDVQVTNPDGVSICAISVCPYLATPTIGAPLGITVWVTDAAGGFLANHTNAAVWRQVATGTGNFAGGTFSAPVPVPMALSNPIYLPFGTMGMAIHMTTGGGVAYTTLTATTTYPGTDMNIICGNGKATPFAAAANANRAWNGSLHYSTTGNGGSAGYGFFGAGCPSTLGITNQVATSRPVLGQNLSVNLNRMPLSLALMIVGFSRTTSAFGPLPVDLTGLGAPGCSLRVSLDVTVTVVGAGTNATWNLGIPNTPSLLGAQLFTQPAVFDPAANLFGIVTGDAAVMLLGNN